ncbi:F-box/kelch-repeat protein At3g23880-like [Prunus avium]|uniref:F-box/kelch-repeat protein At3g23880-like n=1 Tax=Prunus avium TaxID=42229 RepID=A0A6P5SD65_PRUAV|nr:F-box/kelch-repeat protein At3g23880-like [Prunus avium]XP_021814855.1 F-box/kelch-repeat protein At3g23880-like [Prunus avium]
MAHSCKIGEDLLVKILSSLPPKSLMRFKCAAKWWYAQINNPRFVDNQLSNCLHNNQSIFLKRLVPNKDPNASETESVFSMLTFCEDVDDGAHTFLLSRVEDINVPVSMSVMSAGEELRIVGHCHGIICVHVDNYSKVFLWNPAIQEFKLLPSEKYFTDWESIYQQHGPYLSLNRLGWAMGFGYDPISKAYKVVSIIFDGLQLHAHTLYSVVIYPLRVQVYTLGSSEESSSWREIKTYSLETETTFLWPENFEIYFKGMCYWLGTEQQKEFLDIHSEETRYDELIRQVMVSFDMSDEVFDEVALPDELPVHHTSYFGFFMKLRVWNESSIALCVWVSRYDVIPYFGMWLMDDDFGACVWTKHAGFELASIPIMDLRDGGWALPLWKSDELLVVDKDGCTICYNLRTENRMSLPTVQICMPTLDPPIVVYVNSIVSIGLGRQQT